MTNPEPLSNPLAYAQASVSLPAITLQYAKSLGKGNLSQGVYQALLGSVLTLSNFNARASMLRRHFPNVDVTKVCEELPANPDNVNEVPLVDGIPHDKTLLVGVVETAQTLGVPLETLKALIESGEFPKPRIDHGAHVYWRRSDIVAWVNA